MVNEVMETVNQVDMNSVEQLGDFINRYGFMIVFAAIALLIFIGIAGVNTIITLRKNNTDQKMSLEERQASLKHNNDMFELVTKVQTEQIVQLQTMTRLLKNLDNSFIETQKGISVNTSQLDIIRQSVLDCDANHKFIHEKITELSDKIGELNDLIVDNTKSIENNTHITTDLQDKLMYLNELVEKDIKMIEDIKDQINQLENLDPQEVDRLVTD